VAATNARITNCFCSQGRRQKNFQGGKGKKTENSKKTPKIALLILFRGGGATEKIPKNSIKDWKIALLSLYLLYFYHV